MLQLYFQNIYVTRHIECLKPGVHILKASKQYIQWAGTFNDQIGLSHSCGRKSVLLP